MLGAQEVAADRRASDAPRLRNQARRWSRTLGTRLMLSRALAAVEFRPLRGSVQPPVHPVGRRLLWKSRSKDTLFTWASLAVPP